MRPFSPQSLLLVRHACLSARSQSCSRSFIRCPPTVLRSRSIHAGLPRKDRHNGTQEADVDMVHVYKPFMDRKRIGLFIFYGFATYVLFKTFFYKLGEAVDIDLGDEIVDDVTEGDENASIFVPFQFPKKLPTTFYKQSDPDWQEFVRLSGDEARANRVRDELAAGCLRDISSAPKLRRLLGANIVLGSYWLDLVYPDSPPPEYSRRGLEINDEYIAWSEQTIPHSHYVQLRHILWPKALYTAAYNSIKLFTELQLVKAKTALDIPLNQREKQIAAIVKIEQGRVQMQAAQAESEARKEGSQAQRVQLEKGLQQPKPNGSPTSPFPSQSTKDTDPPSHAVNNPLLALLLSTTSIGASEEPPSSPMAGSTDLSLAWKMFLQTLSTTWTRSRLDTQPKGALYVVGQVEVRGDKGRVRCDVQAAYDPKQAKVVYCVCQVRHYWELKQRAKGGP